MSNDHYVAQTYLKRWCNPNHRLLMRAYRKSDRKQFPCKPADVCHEWDGDLNHKYFTDPNVLGEFRKIFEPKWNPTIERIQNGSITTDDRFVAAGYWAHLTTCTPSGRRLGTAFYGQQVRNLMPIILKEFSTPPIDTSALKIEVDPDFVKSVTTKQLLAATWLYYALDWRVMVNDTEVPFITSDNPSAVDLTNTPAVRILPLSPRLCLTASMDMSRAPKNLKCPTPTCPGTIEWWSISRRAAEQINRISVLHAENLVFSMYEDAGVAKLVEEYGDFKPDVEHTHVPLPTGDGYLTGATITIGKSGAVLV